MRSPRSLRNGGGGVESPSPAPRQPRVPSNHHGPPHFHSTVSERKLRRLNILIFVFRLAAFCFSLTAAVFMITNTRGSRSTSPRWYDFGAYRFVVAANGIVALYSFFEMGASVWEISRGATIFPEFAQVWFDFGHDQVFAYLLLSADSAGTELARALRGIDTCKANNGFCVQSAISIALGFASFLFLMLSSLLSGFRVVCFMINGSRFHL